jgi:hypothetical protein
MRGRTVDLSRKVKLTMSYLTMSYLTDGEAH